MHTQEPGFAYQERMRNLGTAVNICNANTGDRQILDACWPASLAKSVKPRLNVRPCLTKRCESERKTYTSCLYPHLHVKPHTCTKVHILYIQIRFKITEFYTGKLKLETGFLETVVSSMCSN